MRLECGRSVLEPLACLVRIELSRALEFQPVFVIESTTQLVEQALAFTDAFLAQPVELVEVDVSQPFPIGQILFAVTTVRVAVQFVVRETFALLQVLQVPVGQTVIFALHAASGESLEATILDKVGVWRNFEIPVIAMAGERAIGQRTEFAFPHDQIDSRKAQHPLAESMVSLANRACQLLDTLRNGNVIVVELDGYTVARLREREVVEVGEAVDRAPVFASVLTAAGGMNAWCVFEYPELVGVSVLETFQNSNRAVSATIVTDDDLIEPGQMRFDGQGNEVLTVADAHEGTDPARPRLAETGGIKGEGICIRRRGHGVRSIEVTGRTYRTPCMGGAACPLIVVRRLSAG